MGIAQADYGRDRVAVMGVSAARLLGHVPRALGVATVAVPKQRPALKTDVGTIRFVTRDVDRLDVQRGETELAQGWVTTPEQTLLDLLDRPELGGLTRSDVAEVAKSLAGLADLEEVLELGRRQRKRAARQMVIAIQAGSDWAELLGTDRAD